MKRFLLIACALASMAVMAQAAPTSIVLKWTAPSQNIDNTPITGVLTYKVYQGAKGAAKTFKTASTATQTTLVPPLGQCFEVTAVVDGLAESAHSAEACVPVLPNAPTGTIIISIT